MMMKPVSIVVIIVVIVVVIKVVIVVAIIVVSLWDTLVSFNSVCK